MITSRFRWMVSKPSILFWISWVIIFATPFWGATRLELINVSIGIIIMVIGIVLIVTRYKGGN